MGRSLLERIKRQIELEGPLTIADYMSTCLSDPQAGYYTTAKPFGRNGDFVTAPEISQIFGELIGIWCVEKWRRMGAPKRFNLVEIGPGRGTLMADLLRAAAVGEGFIKNVQVRLIEISGQLREQQSAALSAYSNKIKWLSGLADIEDIPTIFIGNEFLDALPFRQYVKSSGLWRERMVGVNEGELTFCTGVGLYDPASLPTGHAAQPEGSIFETAPVREAVVARIAQHVGQFGGAGLLIDYGHVEPGFGDTFQAVAGHQYADPLKNPGRADLTGHVDFAALTALAGEGCVMQTQAGFLLKMGLLERAGMLGQGKSVEEQEELQAAVDRLAGAMGKLFKVMEVV